MNLIEHFINGKITKGSSKKTSKVFNPATGEQTAEVNLASKSDVDLAVEKAKEAFVEWSRKPPAQRSRIIFKFKELIEKNSDELTKLIVSEHGKVYEDAKGSLTRGLEVVEFACGIPHLLKGEFTENVGTDVDSWSIRQPLGVCAGITPFNFPAMVPMWMFPLAIACGNTFVLKPSEKSSAKFMAQEGSFSDGFNIKVFPQAIETGYIHMGTIAGKLNGVIPAQTPNGCLIDQLSTSVPTFSVNSPLRR